MLVFSKERNKLNKAIKEKDMKEAFNIIIDGYKTNESQDIRLFELIDNYDIFSVMDELIKEGKTIPEKYLILTSIYWSSQYMFDIGYGTDNKKDNGKYPYLSKVYQQKMSNNEYGKLLLSHWKKLFNDMIKQTTRYRNKTNISKFYYYPDTYEEFVIERSLFSLYKVMFKDAKKEDVFEIMLNCEKYPKAHDGETEIDRLYNIKNSRYHDVQYIATWLSQYALPLTLSNQKDSSIIATGIGMEMPLVTQGIINEIKIFYEDIDNNKILLDPQNIVLFEKLYEQRMPELLNNYQSIDKKHLNIKNRNNQNADQLLYDSLLEIRAIFENFNKEIEQKKIDKLSLSIKMTKEYIKHTL